MGTAREKTIQFLLVSKVEVGRPGNKARHIQLWKNEDWS